MAWMMDEGCGVVPCCTYQSITRSNDPDAGCLDSCRFVCKKYERQGIDHAFPVESKLTQ